MSNFEYIHSSDYEPEQEALTVIYDGISEALQRPEQSRHIKETTHYSRGLRTINTTLENADAAYVTGNSETSKIDVRVIEAKDPYYADRFIPSRILINITGQTNSEGHYEYQSYKIWRPRKVENYPSTFIWLSKTAPSLEIDADHYAFSDQGDNIFGHKQNDETIYILEDEMTQITEEDVQKLERLKSLLQS